MKLDRIVKIIAAIFVIIAAGSAGSFVLKNKIEASSKKIYETRSRLKVLENRDETYSLLKADYHIVNDGLPLLREALPKEDGLIEVVASLDALASETNNTQNLVFDPIANAQGDGEMRSIGFTASLEGNFGSFEDYFKKIQKLPYFIEISNVSIANSSGIFNNNGRMNYKAKLYIKN